MLSSDKHSSLFLLKETEKNIYNNDTRACTKVISWRVRHFFNLHPSLIIEDKTITILLELC